MNYWLMKSEPEECSIDDLKKQKTTLWTGVRNYQARNFMTQQMQLGDLVLFYHSNATPSGIAGLAKVCKLATPDPTQFDKKSDYYDAKSKPEAPRWHCVELEFKSKFKNFLALGDLRSIKEIKEMLLFKPGQRLSIQPVAPDHFHFICKLGDKK